MIKRWIRKMIFRFLVRLMRWARNKSLKAAVEKANRITLETGKTCLIYFIHGQYEVYAKQDVKRVKKDGDFKELSMQELLNKASLLTMKHRVPTKKRKIS